MSFGLTQLHSEKEKQQYNLKKKVLEDVLFSKGMICSSQIPCVWCSTLCTVAVFLSLAGKGRTMWHGYLHRSRLNSDDLICVSNILKKRPCFLWSRHQCTFMANGWCLTHLGKLWSLDRNTPKNNIKQIHEHVGYLVVGKTWISILLDECLM